MSRQLQIEVENDANHRALRRCRSCGAYSRPFDEINGAPRCERCAARARRADVENEKPRDPSEVSFLV